MPPPRAAKISIPRFAVPTDTEDFRAQTRDLCLMHDVFMRACFQHSLALRETELGRLCHDFCCTNPDDMYFPELAAVTRHFKEDPEGASIMGNMSEDLFKAGKRQGLKEGERKGLKQGETKEKRSVAFRMLAAGKLTLEEIAEYVGLSLVEVRALSEQRRGA